MKKRIYEIIDKAKIGDIKSKVFDISISIIILMNIIQLVLISCKGLVDGFGIYFDILNIVYITVFSVEYLLRIWTSDHKYIYDNKIIGAIKFIFSLSGLIDLLAILPFFLPFIGINLSFLRLLRLFKFFRIFELSKYGRSIQMIVNVFKKEKEILISTLIVAFMIIFMSAVCMYSVETVVQPEAFPDIPTAMWWATITLSTVGYGDVYPITGVGRLIASIIAIVGIGIVAIPTGIISAGFVRELEEAKNVKKVLDNL